MKDIEEKNEKIEELKAEFNELMMNIQTVYKDKEEPEVQKLYHIVEGEYEKTRLQAKRELDAKAVKIVQLQSQNA